MPWSHTLDMTFQELKCAASVPMPLQQTDVGRNDTYLYKEYEINMIADV